MNVDIKVVNAFTVAGTGGNPAAVVLQADRFTRKQKQAIASATGFSETAFVGQSDVAAIKLDFYTPTRQIAHCGHATIATFSYLLQHGLLAAGNRSSKETVDGIRDILIDGEEVYMQQRAPVYVEPDPETTSLIIKSIGLSASHVNRLTVCNTGNSYILVEAASADMLATLQPDRELIRRLSEHYEAIGYYVYVRTPGQATDATARMFAPAYGIEEEAATGMAAGPLACYLFRQDRSKTSFTIEQGRYMQPASPSLIRVHLNVAQGNIVSLMAGGSATLIETRQVTI